MVYKRKLSSALIGLGLLGALSPNAFAQGTQFVVPAPPPPRITSPTQTFQPPPTPPTPPTPAVPTRPVAIPQRPVISSVAVFILIDMSDSMLNKSSTTTRLDEARQALQKLHFPPAALVQIWGFHAKTQPILTQTAQGGFVPAIELSQQELSQKMSALHTGGATNLYKSFVESVQLLGELKAEADQLKPHLIIISDGLDSNQTNQNLNEALSAKNKNPWIKISTIGFYWGKQNSAELCQLASTPTNCFITKKPLELSAILQRIVGK